MTLGALPEDTPARPEAPPPDRLAVPRAILLVAGFVLRRQFRLSRLAWPLLGVALMGGLGFLVARQESPRGQARFALSMLAYVQLSLLVPMCAVTLAASFPWSQARDGSLTYWFTSPVPRAGIVLGRFLALAAVACVVTPLPVLALWATTRPDPAYLPPETFPAALLATALAVPVYVAAFGALAMFTRKVLPITVIAIVIENTLSAIPGVLHQMAPVYYSRSIVAAVAWPLGKREQQMLLAGQDPADWTTALLALVGGTVIALGISCILAHVMEYRTKTGDGE